MLVPCYPLGATMYVCHQWHKSWLSPYIDSEVSVREKVKQGNNLRATTTLLLLVTASMQHLHTIYLLKDLCPGPSVYIETGKVKHALQQLTRYQTLTIHCGWATRETSEIASGSSLWSSTNAVFQCTFSLMHFL